MVNFVVNKQISCLVTIACYADLFNTTNTIAAQKDNLQANLIKVSTTWYSILLLTIAFVNVVGCSTAGCVNSVLELMCAREEEKSSYLVYRSI